MPQTSGRTTASYLLPAALVIAGGLLSLPARAESAMQLAGLTGEEYFLGDVPVILSATRLAQPQREAPAATTVITRDMITASGALEIPDLLRLVPGFQVAHSNGHTVTATYHGLSSEHSKRMQVLVDGRSVYGPSLGGVDWTDLPLAIEDIERIEVVRGPNGAAYGANAFLGAINIVTRHAAEDQGSRLKLARGDKDLRKAMLRHGGRMGRLDYRMTLGYRRDDGIDDRHDHKRVNLATFRGDYTLNTQDSLELQFGYNGGPKGNEIGGPLSTDPDRERNITSHFQQATWTHAGDGGDEVRVQFYHNYHKNREPYPSFELLGAFLPDVEPSIDLGTTEERYDLEFQHTFNPQQDKRVVWGASARLDQVEGSGWFHSQGTINTRLYRLFGNLEWRARPDWIINAGAMVEHSNVFDTHLSPRLALTYLANPQHSFRVGYGRALRLPSTYEEFADGAIRLTDGTVVDQVVFSPGGLEPEKITSLELGHTFTSADRRLNLDTKLFHDRIHDRIKGVKDDRIPDLTPTDATEVHLNTGTVNINGIEFALRYRPFSDTLISYSYAYARGKGQALNDLNPGGGQPATLEDHEGDVPTHTQSLFLMHEFPYQLRASATYYKVSAMRWLGDGEELGPQDRLDLRLAKQFRLGGTDSSIALVAQNIGNDYFEFRDDRRAGRPINVFDTRAYIELDIALQ